MEFNKIESIIKSIGSTQDKLIEILIEVQAQSNDNYISKEALKFIANRINIPLSKAYGVASFYSMLSTIKRGKYVIQICNSAPCYINGGKEITKIFENILGIKVNEVTKDGLFSLEFASCFGACNKAPAVRINDEIYGNLDRGKILSLIESIRREEK